MKTKNLLKFQSGLLFAFAVSMTPLMAAVTAEEANKLKSMLMPLGGEKAGNSNGSIPAWDGGFTKIPAGYQQGQTRPDFFAADKPLYSVTGKNVDQYTDKLSQGQKALLEKYPEYRLDVYPTRRTAAAPQWVYDATLKNATNAKIINDGVGFEGAYGGIPFPIPKNGIEVTWNHRLAWAGDDAEHQGSAWIKVAQGKEALLASKFDTWFTRPYYDKNGSAAKFDGVAMKNKIRNFEPASKNGESIVGWTNVATGEYPVWQYLVGQRRVRKAPSLAHDSPNIITSGMGSMDEVFGLSGTMDRHDLKLVGKKELLVPYNNNRAAAANPEEVLGINHLNPDLIRWELHRVWVVEATLKAGSRHVVPKRMYYFDEDSWNLLLSDGWDAKGQLWKSYVSLTLLAPDIPALVGNVVNWGAYNLLSGEYYMSTTTFGSKKQYKITDPKPSSFFDSESMGEGAR